MPLLLYGMCRVAFRGTWTGRFRAATITATALLVAGVVSAFDVL